MIHNATEMVDLIQEIGFLPLLYSGISGYSAEDVVDSDCRYVVYDDGGWDWPMWKWKGPIVTESPCVYGKFFDKNRIYEGENTEALQKYLPSPTRTRSKD